MYLLLCHKHKINIFINVSLQNQIAFYNTFPTMTGSLTNLCLTNTDSVNKKMFARTFSREVLKITFTELIAKDMFTFSQNNFHRIDSQGHVHNDG